MAGYGSDDGLVAYATAKGRTISGDAAVLRNVGSVYIDGAYGWRFPGVPIGGAEQDRAWPRIGAVDMYGNDIAPDTIPTAVVNASYEAALIEDAKSGALGVVISAAKQLVGIKAGSVDLRYATPQSGTSIAAASRPVSTVIEGILLPIIGPYLLPAALIV